MLPNEDPNLLLLRPLTGATDEVVAVHKGLIRYQEKRELTAAALAGYENLEVAIKQTLQGRAQALTEAHRRIRQTVPLRVRGLTVEPQLPPDLLGLLVLQPVVGCNSTS